MANGKPNARSRSGSSTGKRAKSARNARAREHDAEPAKQPDTETAARAESRVGSRVSGAHEPAIKPAINGPSNRPEAKLDDEARTFVVIQNAHWIAPRAVAKAVKEQYGIDITPQAVEAYDPTKAAGKGLASKWKALFEETRKRAIEEEADIGIAHRNVRLRALHRMAATAENQGNLALAAQLLEQAAKEQGEVFTNARVLKGGGNNGAHVFEGLEALFGAVDGTTRTLAQGASPAKA